MHVAYVLHRHYLRQLQVCVWSPRVVVNILVDGVLVVALWMNSVDQLDVVLAAELFCFSYGVAAG